MLSQADEPDRTPKIYLVRHGETTWTISGQHTGRTDIPLTERGERDAQELTARLRGMTFASVLTSPLQRARRTGDLAGFGARPMTRLAFMPATHADASRRLRPAPALDRTDGRDHGRAHGHRRGTHSRPGKTAA